MSDIICITNRRLCKEDFLLRIKKIAAARPAAIILREKDLSPSEYGELAESVIKICKEYHTDCILHSFYGIAVKLGISAIHMPLPALKNLSEKERKAFTVLGASCHSKEDAVCAEKLGCTYVTAGHVFETDCKRGLPARGIEFLREVCGSVSIPVYAIGGINQSNFKLALEAGAKGVCVMSGGMTCRVPQEYFESFGTDS